MKTRAFITLLIITIFTSLCCNAQNALNNNADNIVGQYEGVQQGYKFKAKIVKLNNGTYRAQVFWLEKNCDEQGNKLLDVKNPDKSLRSTPSDQVVLFSGLVYDEKHHEWNGTKIYDPLRGIRAKLVATFAADGRLRLKGSLLGISETVYWKKIK